MTHTVRPVTARLSGHSCQGVVYTTMLCLATQKTLHHTSSLGILCVFMYVCDGVFILCVSRCTNSKLTDAP